MKRRAFLTSAGSSALASITPRPLRAAAPVKPNILLILTDQQFADALSCRIGRSYIHTPHMDSLAANGTFFSRAYCANPLCIPSRTSMFSGRYPVETGIQTNDRKRLDERRFPHMGSLFSRAGYSTAYFGKWHMPYEERDPSVHGFSILAPQKARNDDDIARNAAAFLTAPSQEPFLMVASFVNPHNICQWARREPLPDGPVGSPPPLAQCPPRRPNHATPQDETDIMQQMRRSYQASPTFPVGDFDEKDWREYIWAYYRMIEKVDGLIGKVLGALRKSGREDRTLIVFLSDHGDCQGAHGWNQKTVFYEESARVPLIVSWKGVTKAGVSHRLAQTGIDLIPTLCAYAGIPTPAGLPGMSLMETANGDTGKDPREFIVVSNKMVQGAPIDGRLPVPDGRMLRSRRYKYCVYNEGSRRESLVDLEKDPGEMRNLALDPAHAKVLAQHRRMLADWGRSIGDPFRAIPS